MSKNPRIQILSVAAAALVVTAACTPGAQPAPTTAPAKPTTAPAAASPAASPASSPAAAATKPAVSPAASPATSPAAAASPAAGGDVTASARPLSPMPQPNNMPAGSYMRQIQDRGRLVAGVRQDVRLIGFLNPRTNQIEGFDIDMVKEIAKAIFGDESKVDLRPVTAAARIPSLQEGTVDLVAAAMTITADRKQQIDFSEVYYAAGQRVLVRKDAPYDSLKDMDGRRVCAAKGTTAEQNIPRENPRVEVVQADAYPECLLSLQQGRIDGISTDDVILSGLASQDPNTKLIGPKFTDEPYGIGVAKNKAQFVPFINGVLQQIKANGRWKESYTRWFGEYVGAAPEPPRGTYVD